MVGGNGIPSFVGMLTLNGDYKTLRHVHQRRCGQVRDGVGQGESHIASGIGCAQIANRCNRRPTASCAIWITQVRGIQHQVIAWLRLKRGRTSEGDRIEVPRRLVRGGERADDGAIFHPRVMRRIIGIRRIGREIGIGSWISAGYHRGRNLKAQVLLKLPRVDGRFIRQHIPADGPFRHHDDGRHGAQHEYTDDKGINHFHQGEGLAARCLAKPAQRVLHRTERATVKVWVRTRLPRV